jgi:uncharacterized membrane protein YtjA (UPF0391 family)
MIARNPKKKKKIPTGEKKGSQRAAQILFAIFAVMLILSMVLAATSSY